MPMALKIAAWVVCGAAFIWGFATFQVMNFGLVRNALRHEAPPQDSDRFLKRAAIAVLTACTSVYGAILVYDWQLLAWYGCFLSLTALFLIFSVGDLRYRIRLQRKMTYVPPLDNKSDNEPSP
jgi:hypothetical protein